MKTQNPPIHLDAPPDEFPSISVGELRERLAQGAVLIDVRQPEEHADASIPGSILIPLSELPSRLVEIPASREILVHCRSGKRSARAVAFLRDQELNAINVAGGIEAWARHHR